MPEFNVYQLASQAFAKAMPKFLEMVLYTAKKKVMILCSGAEKAKACDEMLWSYAQLAFLPHGTYKDPYKQEQPVYITHDLADVANDAEVLLIYDAAEYTDQLSTLKNTAFQKVVTFVEPTHDVLANQIAATLVAAGVNHRLFAQQQDGSWRTQASL